MRIHLATDHAGMEHKETVRTWLQTEGFAVIDHGAHEYDPQDDYPDFISKAARAVSEAYGEDRAVIFGGSGQGEAMMANRFPYVRAAVFYGGDPSIPKLSREHNESNILSIGARFVSNDLMKQVVWEWLHAELASDAKYRRRNEKLDEYAPS